MATYSVSWEIEIEADSPREAAQEALAIQRDPNSIATVFSVIEASRNTSPGSMTVYGVEIDLQEGA